MKLVSDVRPTVVARRDFVAGAKSGRKGGYTIYFATPLPEGKDVAVGRAHEAGARWDMECTYTSECRAAFPPGRRVKKEKKKSILGRETKGRG